MFFAVEKFFSFLQIQITVKEEDEEGEILKKIMQEVGRPLIRESLSKYIAGLKEEFSQGMILPKKDEVKPDCVKTLSSGFNKKMNMTPVVSRNDKTGAGPKIETTSVTSTQKFQCTAKEFFDAMTRIEMVTAFTKGRVRIDPVKGGKFELFGGNIVGKFDELVPEKKIVQQWRYKQWPEGHYSKVTLNIDEKVSVLFSFSG